ncbi:MAG: hypothetical protein JW779_11890 [Candidatus Thorarchaeota archaeon]|nr:hypothetical protein [Candidatus Thorarchaeota archaeon]
MESTFQEYPDLNEYIDEITHRIDLRFGSKQSIILYRDLTKDAFTKGESSINIAVVLGDRLGKGGHWSVGQLVKELREFNPDYTSKLNVYFIPDIMIENPSLDYGHLDGAMYVERMMKPLKRFPLSSADSIDIREAGKILHGEDMQVRFPEAL